MHDTDERFFEDYLAQDENVDCSSGGIGQKAAELFSGLTSTVDIVHVAFEFVRDEIQGHQNGLRSAALWRGHLPRQNHAVGFEQGKYRVNQQCDI